METRKLNLDEMAMIEGGSEFFGKFMCNATTGGIGSIYGAWAGGIAAGVFGASAVATGGISVVVGIGVSAALGALIC